MKIRGKKLDLDLIGWIRYVDWGDALFGILITVLIAGMFLSIFLGIRQDDKLLEAGDDVYCESKRMTKVENLPALCLKYFKGDSQADE